MPLDESRFHAVADALLYRLVDDLERTAGDVLDVDLQGGIATIDIDEVGQFVVNKHAPTRQVWLSSPTSGAWHFEYHEASGAWRSTRDAGTEFLALLSGELTRLSGRGISL